MHAKLFSSTDLEATAKDGRELIRARELVERNRIREFQWRDGLATASIAGSGAKPYMVQFSSALTGECTCPAFLRSKRRWCKHLLAVGMLILRHENGEIFEPEALDPELAVAIAKLSEDESKAMLFEAGGRFDAVRTRLVYGRWPSE